MLFTQATQNVNIWLENLEGFTKLSVEYDETKINLEEKVVKIYKPIA